MDPTIEDLDISTYDNFHKLIVEYLCGEQIVHSSAEFDKKFFSEFHGHRVDLEREERKKIIEIILQKIEENVQSDVKLDLHWEQFNEILLAFGQPIVSRDFFYYFFQVLEFEGEFETSISENMPDKGQIIISTVDQLKQGITLFSGLAMIKYGNFRFAFKELRLMSIQDLKTIFDDILLVKDIATYQSRPIHLARINEIPASRTWMIGETSGRHFKAQKELLVSYFLPTIEDETTPKFMAKFEEFKEEKDEHCTLDAFKEIYLEEIKTIRYPKIESISELKNYLTSWKETYLELFDKQVEVENNGQKNNFLYLTWDYMDVYVATSMRNPWEFEETGAAIKEIFDGESSLNSMKLRYFDPTQAKCTNRIDKGLTEALMLKRVACTLYMVQETDTLGKDSELAATLAQNKPTIAYVKNIDDLGKKIHHLMEEIVDIQYFWKRITHLLSLGIFMDAFDPDREIVDSMEKEIVFQYASSYIFILHAFARVILSYIEAIKPFMFGKYHDEKLEELRKEKFQVQGETYGFEDICKIISVGERFLYNKRAMVLSQYHPLSLQVELNTGVANGLLVVREIEGCRSLIENIILNKLKFRIQRGTFNGNEKIDNITYLRETMTDCPYRVVTDNIPLTNSFWNNYLMPD